MSSVNEDDKVKQEVKIEEDMRNQKNTLTHYEEEPFDELTNFEENNETIGQMLSASDIDFEDLEEKDDLEMLNNFSLQASLNA